MSRPLATVAFVLAVLTITSCGGPGDAPTTPTTSALPSSSAAPAPTPTLDPADMSLWSISPEGIGPVRLGVTLADAAAAVPQLTRPADDLCPSPEYLTLAFPGGSYLDPELRLEADRQTGLVTRISITRSGPATASGIGVGSTVADVVAAYPDAQALEVAAGEFVYAVPGEPGWMTFSPDGGSGDSAPIGSVWVQAGGGGASEGCA